MNYMLLPLKRYAEFSGRSRRTEYWMFFLFQILVGVALMILLFMVGGAALFSGGDPSALAAAGGGFLLVMGLYGLFSLAMFIPSIAVGVRRLHDTGRSGWWLLAPLAPYILMFVAMGMAAGSPDSGAAGILMMVSGLAVFGLAITLFVFMLLEGTRGPNRYGPDPKGGASAEVFA